jgi:hypothetical protein
MEVIGVLAGDAELASNTELGDGAQRVGGWHMEVIGGLGGGTKLAGNMELGGSAQMAG